MATKTPDLSCFLDLRSIRAEKAIRLKASFAYFLKSAWHVIEPSRPLIWGIHTEASCEHLQAIADGHIHRLIANIAPGFGKSSMFSVAFPAWIWTRNPHERFLCASYALDLAIRDNRNCRMLIESEWYQSLFGDVFQMAGDQNLKSYFENDRRGYRIATAVRASGTGKRGTGLIIDDPNNGMAGQAEIEATIEWFGRTWQSRLNDQERGFMIVVGQRLYSNDLTGHILELGGWTHLDLPVEYEPERTCKTYLPGKLPTRQERRVPSHSRPGVMHTVTFEDGKAVDCTCEDHTYHPEKSCKHMLNTPAPAPLEPPFWEDPRTEEGQLLCPELLNASAVVELKSSLGTLNYSAQYQQAPVPAGGHIFQKQHERLFTIDYGAGLYLLQTPNGIRAVPMSQCALHITSDVAAKAKEQSDFTVFAVWAITPRKELLLLSVMRGHLTIPKQVEEGYKVYMAYVDDRFQAFWFEDVAYQSALGQFLIERGVPAREFHPKGDKVLRAGGASIWMQLGNVYFLAGASWLEDWRTEIYQFPKGAHDDQVDVFSGMYIVVRARAIPLADDTAVEEQLLIPEPAQPAPPDGIIPITQPFLVPAQEVVMPKPVDAFEWVAQHGGWGDE